MNKIYIKNYNFVFGDMLNKKLLEDEIVKADAVVLLAGLVGDPITAYPTEGLHSSMMKV